MEQRAGKPTIWRVPSLHLGDDRAAQNIQLMAATTNGAAISRTGHSRNIRREDFYLLQFAF